MAHGFTLEHLTLVSEKKPDGGDERVPMLILKPANATGKLPAVIVLHGTGGSMKGMIPVMKELAKHGIIGVAIDARYHGERSGGAKGSAAYASALSYFIAGRALLAEDCWEQRHPLAFELELQRAECEFLTDDLAAAEEHNVDPGVTEMPSLNFTSGYVQRSIAKMPKQGSRRPWRLYQNYALDIVSLRWGKVDDGVMQYS